MPEAERNHWLGQLQQAQWRAAVYLHELLVNSRFRGEYGENARLFLLTSGEKLLAFCTLTQRDSVPDESLFPWVGFVYTAPEHRGHRYSQTLIDHACVHAKESGYHRIYLTSDEKGLYEKYSFAYLKDVPTKWDEVTQLFVREL